MSVSGDDNPDHAMPTFTQLKVTPQARTLVDTLLARTSTVDQPRVREALVRAAGVDGNRVLTLRETRAVSDAFEKVAPGGGPLDATALGQGLSETWTNLAALRETENLDGVSAHFTFQESLAAKLVSDLQSSVARAHGRPMEVNMMIFEFQSDTIEKAIADLARSNPNVTFRIIGDSGQASPSGGNALPALLDAKLPNVQVKFKKDFPYVWSEKLGRPSYNHGSSAGLNHHKGFATFIDGRPDRLVTGSFNWSDTADTKNYEDLTVYTGDDATARRAVTQYGGEFAGFWNDANASLTPNAFSNFRNQKWNELMIANGRRPTGGAELPDDSVPPYTPRADVSSFDVNGWRPEDEKRLQAALGATLARTVIAERKRFGRFESMEALRERVPGLARVPASRLEPMFFGTGKISINVATAHELDAAGFTPKQAAAIVAWRERHGDFDALEDLAKLGVTKGRIETVRELMTAVDVEAFFNSKPFGATAGGTGYGPDGSRLSAVMGADGVVAPSRASVVVGATDLFNRATPATPISLAMYGLSVSSPEFRSLEAAARRGVPVRIVLNDDYNAGAIAAIKKLQAEGLNIDVRVQRARTMHEKFGVVGDDVFSGSANFSESSSTKHSEDRFTVKNHAEIAARFQATFDGLWERSRVV